MRYDFKIKHNGKEITTKGTKKYQGIWELKNFITFLRESANISYEQIELMTDISPERFKNMENGNIEITYNDFRALQKVFKFPRKTLQLFNNQEKPIWATRIKEMRSIYNYTQQQVSEALGISQGTYAGYETGRHEPDLETMSKIADLYKVSIDYLLGRY